jgi:hypothetical protein
MSVKVLPRARAIIGPNKGEQMGQRGRAVNKAKADSSDEAIVAKHSPMRLRVVSTPTAVRTPQPDPTHGMFRGIAVGVLLGAALWVVLIALGIAAYRWLGY